MPRRGQRSEQLRRAVLVPRQECEVLHGAIRLSPLEVQVQQLSDVVGPPGLARDGPRVGGRGVVDPAPGLEQSTEVVPGLARFRRELGGCLVGLRRALQIPPRGADVPEQLVRARMIGGVPDHLQRFALGLPQPLQRHQRGGDLVAQQVVLGHPVEQRPELFDAFVDSPGRDGAQRPIVGLEVLEHRLGVASAGPVGGPLGPSAGQVAQAAQPRFRFPVEAACRTVGGLRVGRLEKLAQ